MASSSSSSRPPRRRGWQQEGAAAAPKSRGTLNRSSWSHCLAHCPYPADSAARRGDGRFRRCGLPRSRSSLPHARCSPLNACSSQPGFSLVSGRLPRRVASGLGDRERSSVLHHLGNIWIPLGILNHKWTGKDRNVLITPLFVVEFTVFNPAGDIKT